MRFQIWFCEGRERFGGSERKIITLKERSKKGKQTDKHTKRERIKGSNKRRKKETSTQREKYRNEHTKREIQKRAHKERKKQTNTHIEEERNIHTNRGRKKEKGVQKAIL